MNGIRAGAALLLAGFLAGPPSLAQLGGQLPLPLPGGSTTAGVVGNASAAQVTLLGILGTATTTALAGTGSLGSTSDARDASQLTGNIPSLLGAEVPQADTIASGNQVDSEASLANLTMTVGGLGVTADFVMARASQAAGAAGTGVSDISNLAINGAPIAITGQPNQIIAIPGGQLVINEQTISSTGATTVNALHFILNGVADVTIASATAGIS